MPDTKVSGFLFFRRGDRHGDNKDNDQDSYDGGEVLDNRRKNFDCCKDFDRILHSSEVYNGGKDYDSGE